MIGCAWHDELDLAPLLPPPSTRRPLPNRPSRRRSKLRPHRWLLLLLHPRNRWRRAGDRSRPHPRRLQFATRPRRCRSGQARASGDAALVVRIAPRSARRERKAAFQAPLRLPSLRQDGDSRVAGRRLRADPRQGWRHHARGRQPNIIPRQRRRIRRFASTTNSSGRTTRRNPPRGCKRSSTRCGSRRSPCRWRILWCRTWSDSWTLCLACRRRSGPAGYGRRDPARELGAWLAAEDRPLVARPLDTCSRTH